MTENTIWSISGHGVTPYSARGINEVLEPIGGAAQLFRTVNGELVDLGATQFRKYRVTVQCNDADSPALDGVWPGMTVTVDCLTELAYLDDTDGAAGRTVVAGSERTADGFVFYRPQLVAKVITFNIRRDEWGAAVGWQLVLEEV